MPLAPVVTGISPIEGVPGTKVIIRGENLGNRPEDLIGEFFSTYIFLDYYFYPYQYYHEI